MNAAFCLSPRSFSEESLNNSSAFPTPPRADAACRLMTIIVDREPQQKELCDVSIEEERCEFLSQRCVPLAHRMSASAIVQTLVPVITACLENDDVASDSIISCVATCLPEVFEVVQNQLASDPHSHSQSSLGMVAAFIMPMLHICASADRESIPVVTTCLQRMTKLMKEDAVVALIIPLVNHLRYASCSLSRAIASGMIHVIVSFPGVLQATNTTIARWFSFYVECAKDLCPIVREAALVSLQAWVELAQLNHIAFAEIPFPLLHDLMADDLSDTVRYLLVDHLISIARSIGRSYTSKYVCPPFYTAVKDRSWRVRYRAACHLSELASLVTNPEEVVVEAVRLSKDEEVEIRAAVASQLSELVTMLPTQAARESIVPCAFALMDDRSRKVQLQMTARIAALVAVDLETAKTVCRRVLDAIEKEDVQQQQNAVNSVPLIVSLLHRTLNSSPPSGAKTSSFASTYTRGSRRPVMAAALTLNTVVPPGTPTASSPAVQEIMQAFVDRLHAVSKSGAWRTREAVLFCIPSFVGFISSTAFHKLNSVLKHLTTDTVSKVRDTAILVLQQVAEKAGAHWSATMAHDLFSSELGGELQNSAVWRLITIRCLSTLLPVAAALPLNDVNRGKLRRHTLKILQVYSEDPVPSVRYALAKTLATWKPWFFVTQTAQTPLVTVGRMQRHGSMSGNAPHSNELYQIFRISVKQLEGSGLLTEAEATELLAEED